MSNLLGKSLLELKKIGRTIADSAVDIGGAVGEAAVNITDHAKKSANLAIKKAEMDELYYQLGKSVFEEGLHPDNAEAMALMESLYHKYFLISALEDESNSDSDDSCGCGCGCDCNCSWDDDDDEGCDCDCDDHCCDRDCDCSGVGDEDKSGVSSDSSDCDLEDDLVSEKDVEFTPEEIEELKKVLNLEKD